MKVKDRTELWTVLTVIISLLLGLGLQLALGYSARMRSRKAAQDAAELFSESAGTQMLSMQSSAGQTDGSLKFNSEAKAGRAEELGGLDILMLVNPWTPMPEGYVPELEYINNIAPELMSTNDWELTDARCTGAMADMLRDCQNAGHGVYVCSAYRSHEKQTMLYENKIQRVVGEGYSWEEAPDIAAQVVAVPGTSEHELGLAADIVDMDYPFLNTYQEETDTQKWLMEHCAEYGFILRFPAGDPDITGIIYEPWHYRYVGGDFAREITELGITLEEYTALRRGR